MVHKRCKYNNVHKRFQMISGNSTRTELVMCDFLMLFLGGLYRRCVAMSVCSGLNFLQLFDINIVHWLVGSVPFQHKYITVLLRSTLLVWFCLYSLHFRPVYWFSGCLILYSLNTRFQKRFVLEILTLSFMMLIPEPRHG